MDVIEELKAKINSSGWKIPAIATAAGIPTERMRKWLKGIGHPKAADTAKIENFLSEAKKSENVPRGATVGIVDGGIYHDKYLALLENQLNLFNNTLIANLTQLQLGVQSNQALIKSGLKQLASMDARSRKVPVDNVMNEINKMTAEFAGLHQQTGIGDGNSYKG